MNQQINLYQPIFRQERKLFSLRTVGITLAVVSVALIAMWGLGVYQVSNLERAVNAVREQQVAQQRMADTATGLINAQTSPEAVNASIKRLSAQLAERTRALDLLKNGAAGSSEGFAGRLSALARRHTDGLWLDRMLIGPSQNFGANVGALLLEGRSVDAQLVPKYLQELAAEPELTGARFDVVVIDRHRSREAAEREAQGKPAIVGEQQSDSTVRFSVSSGGLHAKPGEPRS
ncbi:MAG: hypothetical protein H7Y02_00585 [Candidatus Obscuribacterales bacterium]|nr:hypothetical protein [Steroidobacteraceae bacterium]